MVTAGGSILTAPWSPSVLPVNPSTSIRKHKIVIVTLSCQPQPPYSAAYDVDLQAEYHAFKKR